MSLTNQVKEDIKFAMKEGNSSIRDILRFVFSKASLIAKEDMKRTLEERNTPSDVDMLLAIQRQIKQNKEVIEIYTKENKDFSKEQSEIDILINYLPKQMSEDEIRLLVSKIVSEQPNKGMVMKELSKYRDNLDMKLASSIVSSLLG